MPRVNVCSNCGKSFWAKDADNNLCFICFQEKHKDDFVITPPVHVDIVSRTDEDKSGYVYILKSSNGYYKIGKAKDVNSRLLEWQRTFPIKIKLLYSFACNDRAKVENLLHKKYSKKRSEREWYRLEKSDLEWLLSIKDYELG